MAFLGREADAGLRQGVPLHPRPAAARRRLGDLSRRPGRAQRLGQGVLRAEARGRARPTTRRWSGRARRSSPPAAPRRATASRGSTSRCSARSATTSARASRPSWCLLPSRLQLQPERDVGLDADDRRAAVDHLGLQAGAAARRRSRASPSCSAPTCRAGRRGARAGWSRWTNFFLGVDRVLKWADRWAAGVLAAAGHPGGAPLDARALRELRRPGRDLPADDLHGHRAASASATSRDSAAGAVGAAAARRPADRGGRHGPACSPASRRSGTRRSPRSPWPTPGCPTDHPALLPRGRAGCSTRRCASRATGRSAGPGVEPTRLALPVPQRALPRHRRHGDGPAGPAARPPWPTTPTVAGGDPPRASTGCSRCRTATAAGRPSTSTSTTRS